MQDILERAKLIRLVIFDVDGVLTDGSLFIGDDGQEYKAFNSRDGHGMKLLQRSGVTLAVITARSSEVVRIRMQSLGVELPLDPAEIVLCPEQDFDLIGQMLTLGLQFPQLAPKLVLSTWLFHLLFFPWNP